MGTSCCGVKRRLPEVLNARRHQRDGHRQLHPKQVNVLLCSTPEGIRGMGTGGMAMTEQQTLACSTPEGIRGMGTWSYVL